MIVDSRREKKTNKKLNDCKEMMIINIRNQYPQSIDNNIIYLFIYLFIYLYLSIYLTIYLSNLSIYLFIYLFIYLYLSISIYSEYWITLTRTSVEYQVSRLQGCHTAFAPWSPSVAMALWELLDPTWHMNRDL